MTFVSPPAFGMSSIFHDYSKVSDGAGALVVSTVGPGSLGCDSIFNFTLSLLSDFFPGLGCWDQNLLLFPSCYTACAEEKKINIIAKSRLPQVIELLIRMRWPD